MSTEIQTQIEWKSLCSKIYLNKAVFKKCFLSSRPQAFLIISNKQVIKLGATSDSHPGNSMFFDKCYYIDNQNDITIENLKNRIIDYSINNKICVIAIDGIPPISSNKTPE